MVTYTKTLNKNPDSESAMDRAHAKLARLAGLSSRPSPFCNRPFALLTRPLRASVADMDAKDHITEQSSDSSMSEEASCSCQVKLLKSRNSWIQATKKCRVLPSLVPDTPITSCERLLDICLTMLGEDAKWRLVLASLHERWERSDPDSSAPVESMLKLSARKLLVTAPLLPQGGIWVHHNRSQPYTPS